MSNELTRRELVEWLHDVGYRISFLLFEPGAFDHNEYEVLESCRKALMDELDDRNRRDPVHDHLCEGCGDARAALWWLPTDMRLCAYCWKREWEIERAAELAEQQRGEPIRVSED